MPKIPKIFWTISFAGLVLALALHAKDIWASTSNFLQVFSNLTTGAALAFVLNVPMKKFEGLLGRWRCPSRLLRPISILLVVLLLLLIGAATVAIILPNLSTTISQLGQVLNKLFYAALDWAEGSQLAGADILAKAMEQIQANSGTITKATTAILGNLTGNIKHVFTGFFNGFLIITFTLSMLASKEYLGRISKRLLALYLPPSLMDRLDYIGRLSVETYDKFLMGQIAEACIVSLMIFTAYSLCRLPYAAMTAVLAGILSFIPYIGSLSACLLGAIFIFPINPWQALLSIAVFQAVQLVEGNVIYPKVVGNSVGLPGLFTLAAATVGGSLFGLAGMIFLTPVFAVIYRLVREFVSKKEAQREQAAANAHIQAPPIEVQ